MRRRSLLLTLALYLAPPAAVLAQTAGLGAVSFPNSGARRAQPAFLRGLALLHSFAYDDAAEAFQEAQRVDSSFAMAYWGEALSYDHPLWGSQDSTAARAVLARFGATPAQRIARGETERERAYLSAVEALYGAGAKAERHRAYEAAMAQVHEAYPDDLEAASLYALALLTIRPAGATDLRSNVRAAAIAEEVLRRNPTHPGATHYLIHAYDDPVLAPLGLPVAQRYARIAPRAEHALHMPSHIFLQTGHWDEMVASNEAAWSESKAWVKRKGLPSSELDLHAAQWLHYGYLEQGRFGRARALADSLEDFFPAAQRRAGPMHVRRYLSLVAVQAAVETGRDSSAPRGFSGSGPLLYLAAASAARRGDRQAVDTALGVYRRMVDSASATTQPVHPAMRVMERELTALAARANGRGDEAVAALTEAATLEDGIPAVGPPVVPPAREQLGGLLLELGRLPEAAAAFDAALLRTPNRSATLLGRARVAARAGDEVAAKRYYRMLLVNWRLADTDLPELAEARAAVARAEAVR